MRCNNPSSPIPSTPIHPINITPCTNIQTQAANTAQPYAHAEFAQSRCTSNKLWRPKGPRPTDSKILNTPPKGVQPRLARCLRVPQHTQVAPPTHTPRLHLSNNSSLQDQTNPSIPAAKASKRFPARHAEIIRKGGSGIQ